MPRLQRAIVFFMTFASYAAYPCSRTYWAYIQDTMQSQIPDYTTNFTGVINLTFLFLYAIAMKL